MDLTLALSLLGAGGGLASLVFVAMQTKTQSSAAELTLNLQVMERLDTVLLQIAEDPELHAAVWSPTPPDFTENDRVHVMIQSLIDPVDMALCAVARLPSFRRNGDDWRSYARYLIENSGAVRVQIERHPEWWPDFGCELSRASQDARLLTRLPLPFRRRP